MAEVKDTIKGFRAISPRLESPTEDREDTGRHGVPPDEEGEGQPGLLPQDSTAVC